MNDIALPAHNADELGQYQSLSTLAVLALLMGAASPLLFASPIFSVIPVCGIAIACLALLRIAASDGALTGRFLAKAGLALSVAFLMAPVAHSYVRDAAALGSAEQTAQDWLKATASEDWNQAASLMTPRRLYDMMPRSPAPNAPPPTFDRAIATQQLARDETVETISAWDKEGDVKLTLHGCEFNWDARQVEAGCSVMLARGDAEPLDCWVLLERKPTPEGQMVWLVKSWKLLSAAE